MTLKSTTLFGLLFLCASVVLSACNDNSSLNQPKPTLLGMPRTAGITWQAEAPTPWGEIRSLEWSKDSQKILAGGQNETIIWDVRTGVKLKRIVELRGASHWDPTNTLIANSGTVDNPLKVGSVLDLNTGVSTPVIAPVPIRITGWSPDGQHLLGTETTAILPIAAPVIHTRIASLGFQVFLWEKKTDLLKNPLRQRLVL